MKKLMSFAIVLTMLFAVGFANAQSTSRKKDKTKSEKATAKAEKATKDAGESAHLTKSGKADKRFKENKAEVKKETKAKKEAVATTAENTSKAAKKEVKAKTAAVASTAAATRTEATHAKNTASAKVADQVDNSAKGPHGETVYSGPRGGKYFINKNGKKEYLSSLKKH